MKGLVIAEHLAAISVFALAIGWLGGLANYSRTELSPLRLQVEAYQAANVALVTGESQVVVAGVRWQVKVGEAGVQVSNSQADYHTTLRRDAD